MGQDRIFDHQSRNRGFQIFGKQDIVSHTEAEDDVQIRPISVQYPGLRDGVTRCLNSSLYETGKVEGLSVDPADLTANRGNPKPLFEYFVKGSHLLLKTNAKGDAQMSVTHFPAKENEFLEPIHPHVKLGLDRRGYPQYLPVFSILIDIDHIAPNIRTVHPLATFLAHTDGTIHFHTPFQIIPPSYKIRFILTP